MKGDVNVPTFDEVMAGAKVDTSDRNWKLKVPKPPKATFDSSLDYVARMKTTKGEIAIRMLPDVAPMHVTSFLYLAKLGFYDGLAFHRVIPDFMAQGGCPKGDGTGGPGYQFDGEFSASVRHDRAGLLSMANAGPGTDGSQFFITFVATPWLDNMHTIFGEVVEGSGVLTELERVGSRSGKTSEKLLIESVSIESRPR